MYRNQRNYENLNRAKFIGAGSFDIPHILAEGPADPDGWIGFNYANTQKAAKIRRIRRFISLWMIISSIAYGQIPMLILICCVALRPCVRRIFQPIQTSRRPYKSGIITANTGSVHIGRVTESPLFRRSHGATKAVLSGALMENPMAVLWPFPAWERSLINVQQNFSGSAMTK